MACATSSVDTGRVWASCVPQLSCQGNGGFLPVSRTISALPIPDAHVMTFLPQSKISGFFFFSLSSHLTWLLSSLLFFVGIKLRASCVPPKHPTTEPHPTPLSAVLIVETMPKLTTDIKIFNRLV